MRETFANAVETGFVAEIESSKQQPMHGAHIDHRVFRSTINKKSEYAVWIAGLSPILAHGWPRTIDRDRYRELMFAVGRYLGWIDDIRDVRSDIDACQWSNVLIEIAGSLRCPSDSTLSTLQHALLSALACDQTTAGLVKIGVQLYDEVAEDLEAIDINQLPLLLMLADSTHAWFDMEG